MAFLAYLSASVRVGSGRATAFRVGSSASPSAVGSMNGRSRTLANAAAMSYFSSGGHQRGAVSATNWCGARRTLQSTCPTSSSLSMSTIEASAADSVTSSTVIDHPAFEIVQTDVVSEYGADCTLYRHTKSGAELLSVSTDDDNKCFGITFRTPPQDSTGVPHILEHSVLCGSRKYKTKDPFVQLLQGSLQTFLNAFTYPDRTCYVVASQNTKDFYNLINVYADAVFHPRAITDPMVHAQEGWHLELEDVKEPLTYKGGKFSCLLLLERINEYFQHTS